MSSYHMKAQGHVMKIGHMQNIVAGLSVLPEWFSWI